MREVVEKTAAGAIVFDADILHKVTDSAFSAEAWVSAEPVTGTFKTGGRGNTLFVSDGRNEFVLRHYFRGGLVGRLVRDNYVWPGEEGNRAFQEWRLLGKLVELGLPVPMPAAARYCRSGFLYKADLMTVRVPGIRSLSDRISAAPGERGFWQKLGAGIWRFHRAGVFHADLNVSNVQLNQEDELWVLDFDRGKLLPAGAWQQRNLARFHRSLRKLKQFDPRVHFTQQDWNDFLEGYFSESRSA